MLPARRMKRLGRQVVVVSSTTRLYARRSLLERGDAANDSLESLPFEGREKWRLIGDGWDGSTVEFPNQCVGIHESVVAALGLDDLRLLRLAAIAFPSFARRNGSTSPAALTTPPNIAR